MKKSILSIAATVLILGFTSCQKENITPSGSGEMPSAESLTRPQAIDNVNDMVKPKIKNISTSTSQVQLNLESKIDA